MTDASYIDLSTLEDSPHAVDQDLLDLAGLEDEPHILDIEDIYYDNEIDGFCISQVGNSAGQLYPKLEIKNYGDLLEFASLRIETRKIEHLLEGTIFKGSPLRLRAVVDYYIKNGAELDRLNIIRDTPLWDLFRKDSEQAWKLLGLFVIVDVASYHGILSDEQTRLAFEGIINCKVEIRHISFKNISELNTFLGIPSDTGKYAPALPDAVHYNGKIAVNSDKYPARDFERSLVPDSLDSPLFHELVHCIQYLSGSKATLSEEEADAYAIQAARDIKLGKGACNSLDSCEQLVREGEEEYDRTDMSRRSTSYRGSQVFGINTPLRDPYFNLLRESSENNMRHILGWAYLYDKARYQKLKAEFIKRYELNSARRLFVELARQIEPVIADLKEFTTRRNLDWGEMMGDVLEIYGGLSQSDDIPLSFNMLDLRIIAKLARTRPDHPAILNDYSMRSNYDGSLIFIAYAKAEVNPAEGKKFFDEVLIPALRLHVRQRPDH